MSEHEHLHEEEHCGCGCGHDHEHEHHEHNHDEHGDSCGCGHDHHDHDHDEHEHHHHDHNDSCGCGHDHHDHDHHEHEHHHHEHGDSCGCGHDHHEHDHHHDHDDSCGCGHDHHDYDHHEHGDSCGCGHDHHDHNHDECGCGHDHHEHDHHEHGDSCGCGHDHHEHDHHDHGDSCGCGHDHHDHDHHEHEAHEHHAAGPEKQVFILENLGCANCAAKMERRINELDDVADATITFATKQLRISGTHLDALVPQIQEICASIESEVKVVPKTPVSKNGKDSRVYILENLGCANCAAKMERRINELDDVADATITFATKQLRITGKRLDSLLPQIQEICASIESEVKVVPKTPSPAASKSADKVAEQKDAKAEHKKTLAMIGIGAVLFVIGEILEHTGASVPVTLGINIVAYLILGLRIVVTAAKNLTHGQVFDENFLMSIATLGAFAIGDYPEAVGVMLFYRIGEFFEDIAVERSRSQIMDAVDLRPETVNLVSGNDIRVIPAEETEVGDVLLVRPGDRIPLDGTILEGNSRLDTSAITGEPVPVTVKKGDEVVSGCVNVSGQLKIRVDKPLSESMVTRILDSVENAAASKPKIDRFITRFARVYTPFVVVLALATAIIPSLVSGNWYYWVHTALTFLVISCPCALVLSVPLAFFSGIGAGSKKGILFKGGISLEQLHNVKAVVMDKTGTITEGNFVVQEVVSAGSLSSDELLTLAAGCEQISTHPIATSIVTAAQEKGLSLDKPAKLEEIAGHGISAQTDKGTLLVGNRKLMDEFHIDLSAYQKKGFGSEVLIALNGKFEGHIVISDTIKGEAKSAISALKKLGITTAMLTGDAQDSADAVAAETGIDEVHAKLLPQDKLAELQKIRAAHTSVMFVGDGINDAPVLAGADVGAAMGSGADAAIEAADVVFMNSNMDAIPQAIRIANATSAISWQNVVFALIIKAIVMILGLTGHASMWFAVFADTGVAMLCILNSIRILYKK